MRRRRGPQAGQQQRRPPVSALGGTPPAPPSRRRGGAGQGTPPVRACYCPRCSPRCPHCSGELCGEGTRAPMPSQAASRAWEVPPLMRREITFPPGEWPPLSQSSPAPARADRRPDRRPARTPVAELPRPGARSPPPPPSPRSTARPDPCRRAPPPRPELTVAPIDGPPGPLLARSPPLVALISAAGIIGGQRPPRAVPPPPQ